MIYVDLLMISLLMVFVIDISGFLGEIEHFYREKYHNLPLKIRKPFCCSFCMTWWIGLIYLLIVGEFGILNIGYVALLCLLTGVFQRGLMLIVGIIEKIIMMIEKLFRI